MGADLGFYKGGCPKGHRRSSAGGAEGVGSGEGAVPLPTAPSRKIVVFLISKW